MCGPLLIADEAGLDEFRITGRQRRRGAHHDDARGWTAGSNGRNDSARPVVATVVHSYGQRTRVTDTRDERQSIDPGRGVLTDAADNFMSALAPWRDRPSR